MWNKLLAWGLGCLVVLMMAGSAVARFDYDVVRPSVVTILALDDQGRAMSSGSGFVIDDRGFVITNNHVVVEDLRTNDLAPYLVVPDGSFKEDDIKLARVVWRSTDYDLAVIEVEDLRRPPVPLSLPDPKLGTPVWAVGFPGVADIYAPGEEAVLTAKVTSGVVSFVGLGRVRKLVQHDAPINQGNSGGPLFNGCNQVIAVNTFIPNKEALATEMGMVGIEGVFYGSHISVLVDSIEAEIPELSFTGILEPCVIEGIEGGIPDEVLIAIAAVALLAISGLGWGVYSHARLRYAISDMGHSASRVVRSVSQSVSPNRRSGQAPHRGHADHAAADMAVGQWTLTGRDASGAAVTLRFRETEVRDAGDEGLVVGRQRSLSDRIVADGSVSRRHASIKAAGSDLVVVDLNSKYGTVVDGQKLTPYGAPARLREGSELQIGDVTLKVRRG